MGFEYGTGTNYLVIRPDDLEFFHAGWTYLRTAEETFHKR